MPLARPALLPYSRPRRGGPPMRRLAIVWTVISGLASVPAGAGDNGLWTAYKSALSHAKYIDLTHTIAPDSPVWHGFRPSKFGPTINPAPGKLYSSKSAGFGGR